MRRALPNRLETLAVRMRGCPHLQVFPVHQAVTLKSISRLKARSIRPGPNRFGRSSDAPARDGPWWVSNACRKRQRELRGSPMSSNQPDEADDPGVTPYTATPDFPPFSSTVTVEFAAQSRRGLFHSVNEDHYLIVELGRHEKTLLTSLPESVVPKRFDEFGYAM